MWQIAFKTITVLETYRTVYEVDSEFYITNGDEAIRELLLSEPVEGLEQQENLLLITDIDTGEQIHFDKEKL